MADAVTYADLRFSEISLQEMKMDDTAEDADPSDVMYENVMRPPRDKEASAAPPRSTTWFQHLKARLQVWAPLLSMLLLLLCLILLATAIVITVQYFSVSRDLQFTSADHKELNSTLSHRLQSQEDSLLSVREELERSREELKKSQELLDRSREELKRSQELWEKEKLTLKLSIQQEQSEVKNLQEMKDRAEEEQREAESRLNSIQTELCPEDWIYFGRRCLLFSSPMDLMDWYDSRKFCQNKKSNLLVVKEEDSDLKNYLGRRQAEYWVGKMPKSKWTWEWPSSYGISYSGYCGKVTSRGLGQSNCYQYKCPCICERSLVQVQGFLEYSPRFTEIALWGKRYTCEMEN